MTKSTLLRNNKAIPVWALTLFLFMSGDTIKINVVFPIEIYEKMEVEQEKTDSNINEQIVLSVELVQRIKEEGGLETIGDDEE